MTDFLKVKNRAVTSLAKELLIGDTIMEVVDASILPDEGRFRLTIEDEIVEVTGVSGATLTIERGVEGTTPSYHANGRTVSLNITAGIIEELQGAVGEGGGSDIVTGIIAGDTARHTNSAEKSTGTVGFWVKLKETKLGVDVLSLNIDVQGKGAGSADPYAKLAIYKNGSLKKAHVNMTSAYKTYSYKLNEPCVSGDLIQVYGDAYNYGWTVYARDLVLKADKGITEIGGNVLAEPLLIAGAVNLNAVDQDP